MHNFFELIEYHSTCLGRSLRPSSGVQGCTYSFRYIYSLGLLMMDRETVQDM